jgi:DNA-binding PadR family transcriptional regulator
MLQFVSSKVEGRGFNEIARFLTEKGYSGKGKTEVHPTTVGSLLKKASEEKYVVSDKQSKTVKKGKPNPYRITKKGSRYLIKYWLNLRLESIDPEEIKIPPNAFKFAFSKAQATLDDASLRRSHPLDPVSEPLWKYLVAKERGDKLGTAETNLFFERNKEKTAREMLNAVTIKSFITRGSKPILISENELIELCTFMATYYREESAFDFILSYDPSRKNPKQDPKLAKDLDNIDLNYFLKWLHEFKKVEIPKEKLQLLAPCFQRADDTKISEEESMYRLLWKEFESKKKDADPLIEEVRWLGNKIEEEAKFDTFQDDFLREKGAVDAVLNGDTETLKKIGKRIRYKDEHNDSNQ